MSLDPHHQKGRTFAASVIEKRSPCPLDPRQVMIQDMSTGLTGNGELVIGYWQMATNLCQAK